MTLRLQLLLVSLLTLVLPWAGCQYVREMEQALRHGQEQALLSSARAISGALHERPELLYPGPEFYEPEAEGGGAVYVHPLRGPVSLDGYVDDWGLDPSALRALAAAGAASPPDARYAAGAHGRYLYLFVSVRDGTVLYAAADGAPGQSDGIHLALESLEGERVDYGFTTSAPGRVNAMPASADGAPLSGSEPRIQGEWQATENGYHLEIRVPRWMLGNRLGLAVRDADSTDAERTPRRLGTFSGARREDLGLLIHPSQAVQDTLAALHTPTTRLRVVDLRGWLLAQVGALAEEDRPAAPAPDEESSGNLLAGLYLAILGTREPSHREAEAELARLTGANVQAALGGRPETIWYRAEDEGQAVISAAHPILSDGEVIGAVVLEQTSDAILTLTNAALTRLLNLTLLATSLAAVGLLSFATVLSIRIRRLRNAAEAAVSPEGRIEARIPETRSRDELGDLSRSFATLLERLRQYTQYLQTLAGKLSHELRTPLAVVRTSLDNLDSQALDPAAQTYADRAREGSERLAAILQAMSAASRVEQAIEHAEAEPVDLGELLRGMVSAYRDVYTERRLELDLPDGPLPFVGVPDLLVQMLDKLVDNAVDFSPSGGRIDIRLDRQQDAYELSVTNEGPPLPEQMRSHLFDSMVSLRNGTTDTPHMGLGLFIVRLIVEFHSGRIQADNLPDESGVAFHIRLPHRRP